MCFSSSSVSSPPIAAPSPWCGPFCMYRAIRPWVSCSNRPARQGTLIWGELKFIKTWKFRYLHFKEERIHDMSETLFAWASGRARIRPELAKKQDYINITFRFTTWNKIKKHQAKSTTKHIHLFFNPERQHHHQHHYYCFLSNNVVRFFSPTFI